MRNRKSFFPTLLVLHSRWGGVGSAGILICDREVQRTAIHGWIGPESDLRLLNWLLIKGWISSDPFEYPRGVLRYVDISKHSEWTNVSFKLAPLELTYR